MNRTIFALLAAAVIGAVIATAIAVSVLDRSRGATGASRDPEWCDAPAERVLIDPVALEPLFGGRDFEKPVQLLQHPRERDTWFVVLHRGVVLRIDGEGSREVLDLSARIDFGDQWGLQQIAFHPNFPDDARLFVTYVAPESVSVAAVVETLLDGRRVRDAPVEILLSEQQHSDWHPIGGLAFGPDGYLYIGWGEGSRRVPDPTILRSKMLRIDVDRRDARRAYSVPDGNPFLGPVWRPEVFATGLRNPWRFTFDRVTGALWLGDVGEASYEEINRIEAGDDFGWPVWEGLECRLPQFCERMRTKAPVYLHSHSEMCAAIGGYVYRGTALPGLRGKYVYGNGCRGTVHVLAPDGEALRSQRVARPHVGLASFAEDIDGELYLVAAFRNDANGKRDEGLGQVYKLVPNPALADVEAAPEDPRSLAELGCIAADRKGLRAPANMVEYALTVPAWEDGASIRRFMSTTPSPTTPGLDDPLAPPRGSMVLKTYLEGGRPVQTQMLARRAGGNWDAYLYEWNEDGSDARMVAGAELQCQRCHNERAGMLRALTVSQLNREFAGAHQVQRLIDLGVLQPASPFYPMQTIPRIDDDGAGVRERARTYLDVNCSSCHRPGGESGSARFDLRRSTPLPLTGLCATAPSVELIGHEDARLLAPGAPERSSISIRMHATDLAAMPPGRATVDPDGTRVVDAWIRSLETCTTPAAD